MTEPLFSSSFAEDLNGLIEWKKATGYAESTYLPKAKTFDAFCMKNYPDESVVTEPLAVQWIKYSLENQASSVHERISFLRTFGRYQVSIGKHAYVIRDKYTAGRSVFLPYIMTDSELENLFMEIDRLFLKDRFKQLLISTYFRLTYTCGLRPREGRELLRGDADFSTSEIRLVNTKWHKSRTIVMSDDMAELLKKYVAARDAEFNDSPYMFPVSHGGTYTANAIMGYLRKAFAKSKPDIDKDLLPAIRVYDLRHRFATKVLHNWLDSGVSLNSRLPYLQAYMGHKDLNATAYYIHLLPENLVKSAGIDWEKMNGILPEVELWEK